MPVTVHAAVRATMLAAAGLWAPGAVAQEAAGRFPQVYEPGRIIEFVETRKPASPSQPVTGFMPAHERRAAEAAGKLMRAKRETQPDSAASAQAEEGVRKAAEAQAAARREAELAEQLREAEARAQADADSRRQAEAAAREKAEAEALARRETELAERRKAEAQARKQAAPKALAQREAELKASRAREAEEKARREAEAQALAKREAEAKARKDAEAQAAAKKQAEAQAKAKREAVEKTKLAKLDVKPAAAPLAPPVPVIEVDERQVKELMDRIGCPQCHAWVQKKTGPPMKTVLKTYAGKPPGEVPAKMKSVKEHKEEGVLAQLKESDFVLLANWIAKPR